MWSADVELDDGRLQQLYTDYQDKRHFIKAVGVDNRAPLQVLRSDLEQPLKNLLARVFSKASAGEQLTLK